MSGRAKSRRQASLRLISRRRVFIHQGESRSLQFLSKIRAERILPRVFVIFPVSRLRRALLFRPLNSSHPFLQLHCLARTYIYLPSHPFLHLSVIFPLSPRAELPQIGFVADDTPVNRLFVSDADIAGRSLLSPLSLVRFLSLSKRPPPPILPLPGVNAQETAEEGRIPWGIGRAKGLFQK
jgi:hypothetical protein